MYHHHAMHFPLYPPIPYLQASDHSVTVEVLNNMLFVGTPFSVTRLNIFIHSCRSCLWHYWSRCGPHLFPLFRRLRSRFRKYLSGVMMCAAWLIFLIRYSRLSLFILVRSRDAMMSCTQAVYFYLGRNTCRERVWISQPRQFLCS